MGYLERVKINNLLVVLVSVILLFITGCGHKENETTNNVTDISYTQPSSFSRSTEIHSLSEEANPYLMIFSEDGFAFFEDKSIKSDDQTGYVNQYDIYYQNYDETAPVFLGTITDGYIAGLSFWKGEEDAGIAILSKGDETRLSVFDKNAEKVFETGLAGESINAGISPLVTVPDKHIIIGNDNTIICYDTDGNIINKLEANGYLKKLVYSDSGKIFGLVERQSAGNTVSCICELTDGNTIKTITELNEYVPDIWSFEDGIAYVSDSQIIKVTGEGKKENVIDYTRQDIIGSEIIYIGGTKDEIKVVCLDNTISDGKVYSYTFTPKIDGETDIATDVDSSKLRYTDDGRKIVTIAVPKDCIYKVSFHIKKYNQMSDDCYMEMEEYDEPLEDYLGKENRPDIIMFNDSTEVADYVEKGVIENLIPLIEENDSYSIDDIIPRARELMSYGSSGEMYALGGTIWLMLMISNGEENEDISQYGTAGYLEWYDDYLTDRDIRGCGSIENILYSCIADYYDEENLSSSFDSDEFMDLMKKYKKILDDHPDKISWMEIQEQYGETACGIVAGPRRHITYCCRQLSDPTVSLEGIPCRDGRRVYIKIVYPMAILETSESKKEATDFILYFSSLEEYLACNDTEGSYGKNACTLGMLSVYRTCLNSQIFESEKPYAIAPVKSPDGTVIVQDCYYTEEQCDHLLELIDSAEADSKMHIKIYEMLMEEMEPYLKGDKDCDSCCNVLQKRVQLYMSENKK